MGFGLIFLAYTNSLTMFYISFILLGFGAGGCTAVVTMTAVTSWFAKSTGKALGIMSCGYGASGLLIPLIVWLIDVYGWRTTLILLGLGAWVLALPLFLIIRNRPEDYYYECPAQQDDGNTLTHLNLRKNVSVSKSYGNNALYDPFCSSSPHHALPQ